MYKRSIGSVLQGFLQHQETFFLWGPRQAGKSMLLRSLFPDAWHINLLKSEEYARYMKDPALLRHEIRARPEVRFVVIDEVQKVPALLDEVHLLIEEDQIAFALCGSSARKLKRGHANLLGGRAIRTVLYGLTSQELGKDFDLARALQNGFLPKLYLSTKPSMLWRSYVSDYLKVEIAAEGLVRNFPAFSEFLNLSAISDTEIVSFQSFARDCGVSPATVKGYYELLEDTLLGSFVDPFLLRPKRRTQQSRKFYFFDVGLVNYLAGRQKLQPKTDTYGKAFENWVYHELCCYLEYHQVDLKVSYWRLSSGIEVDFIIGSAEIAIECKAGSHYREDWLHGLREFKQEYPEVRRRIVVSQVERSLRTDDGIDVLSAQDFCRQLWSGDWLG